MVNMWVIMEDYIFFLLISLKDILLIKAKIISYCGVYNVSTHNI